MFIFALFLFCSWKNVDNDCRTNATVEKMRDRKKERKRKENLRLWDESRLASILHRSRLVEFTYLYLCRAKKKEFFFRFFSFTYFFVVFSFNPIEFPLLRLLHFCFSTVTICSICVCLCLCRCLSSFRPVTACNQVVFELSLYLYVVAYASATFYHHHHHHHHCIDGILTHTMHEIVLWNNSNVLLKYCFSKRFIFFSLKQQFFQRYDENMELCAVIKMSLLELRICIICI